MSISQHAPTHLKYWDDTYLFRYTSTMLDIVDNEAGGHVIGKTALSLAEAPYTAILDSTICHPQGGGQPSDAGVLTLGAHTLSDLPMDLKELCERAMIHFVVQDVQMVDKVVLHHGHFISNGQRTTKPNDWRANARVTATIDGPRRLLLSRLHSAGHLLDRAMTQAGFTEFKPVGGNHSTIGTNVEYVGDLPEGTDRQSVGPRVQTEIDEIVQRDWPISSRMVPFEDMARSCAVRDAPAYLPKDEDVRLIGIEGLHWCPCGGTHVRSTKELGAVKVTKFEKKQGRWRLKYAVTEA